MCVYECIVYVSICLSVFPREREGPCMCIHVYIYVHMDVCTRMRACMYACVAGPMAKQCGRQQWTLRHPTWHDNGEHLTLLMAL